MKLSKIYSNNPEKFKMIEFDEGINFILSEDHSVGKSTLLKLVDYCLFKSKPDFLKLPIFNGLEFFLEVKIKNDLFITIKRPLTGKANDCIKISSESSDCLDLPTDKYDFKGGQDKALEFFQEKSDFTFPNLRHYLTYFIRDQDNQSDEFRLNKFLRSRDIDYKPIIANLLGIDGNIVRKKYELEDQIESDLMEIKKFEYDLGAYKTKDSILEEISIYENQLLQKENKYKEFDFYLSEHNISQELVDSVEQEIYNLNSLRNSLRREIDYIKNALATEISINIEDIKGLFEEMEILFPNELKNNYEKVFEFNKQITQERKEIFGENKKKFEEELQEINNKLKGLNTQRKKMLGILNETDTMLKFKKLEEEIIDLKASIKTHRSKLDIFMKIEDLNKGIEANRESLSAIIRNQDSLTNVEFVEKIKGIIKKFGRIIFDRDLAFSVGFNTKNNLEFSLKIANRKGFDNFEDAGNTVRKLLCFVFATSLASVHNIANFFQFVAFDSPFDGDKNVWQDGIYNALKELSSEGIQTIVTTISDEVRNSENLAEIKSKYLRRFLSTDDKLLGDF